MNSSFNYKNIPSVNILLEELANRYHDLKPEYLKQIILIYLDTVRNNPQKYRHSSQDKTKFKEFIIKNLSEDIEAIKLGSMQKVINATGVVLHTGLGRAPLDDRSIESLKAVCRYTNLEINMKTGKRGERMDHISTLLKILTGAEDGIACNNNAAAVMLMLNTAAYRKEVILSRGEMVEIGGSFRLPEVMKSSGCRLKEIGTTNRTHLKDYEEAVSKRTGAILICHTSNYEIKGFTKRPTIEAIVELAKKYDVPVLYDLGSGSLIPTINFGSDKEPEIMDILSKNVDLVSFSGDKLLGGPQSGLIVGKSVWVKKCQKNHLLRTLRLDKFMLRLLQQTLQMYLYKTSNSLPELTAIQALTESAKNIKKRSQRFIDGLPKNLNAKINIIEAKGKVGSGAYPTMELESFAIQIQAEHLTEELLAKKLRQAEIPIISYILDDNVMIDLRAVAEDEEKHIVKALIKTLKPI